VDGTLGLGVETSAATTAGNGGSKKRGEYLFLSPRSTIERPLWVTSRCSVTSGKLFAGGGGGGVSEPSWR